MKHLFIRVLRHTLVLDEEDEEGFKIVAPEGITRLPRSSSPDGIDSASDDDEPAMSEKKMSSEMDEEKTLAGSRFSSKRLGALKNAHMKLDLEQGPQIPRGRVRSATTLRFVSSFPHQ